jgi:NTP pyrophosphatase (non-canonical NTP hydrolase)
MIKVLRTYAKSGGILHIQLHVAFFIFGKEVYSHLIYSETFRLDVSAKSMDEYADWVWSGYESNRFLAKDGYSNEQVDMLYACSGLAQETMEIQSMVMKHMRLSYPIKSKVDLVDEMGDQLWFFMLMAKLVGVSIDDIATCNRLKLGIRYPNGDIKKDNRNKDKEREAIENYLKDNNHEV